MRRPITILGAVLLIVASAAPAWSQGKIVEHFERKMHIERQGKQLLLSFECPEVFSDWVRRELSSGFVHRVVFLMQLRKDKGKAPLALGVLQYTIRYFTWDEHFKVRIEGIGADQALVLPTMDELVKTIGTVRRQPLQPLIGLPETSSADLYRVRVRIEVNPKSSELLRKVRDYLVNPGGRRAIGAPRSFFGSFARIFVDEQELMKPDAVLTYRSRPMKLSTEARSD